MARLTREQLERLAQFGARQEKDAAAFIPDPLAASALFARLIAQIAAVDAVNHVDPLERWAREKAAEREEDRARRRSRDRRGRRSR